MLYKYENGYRAVDLLVEFPGTSFPDDLSQYAWEFPYIWAWPTPAPICGCYERALLTDPVSNLDGKWRQGWGIERISDDEIKEMLIYAVQSKLDSTAQERHYDNIMSLCTYATSTNQKFAAEGQAGVVYRDSCWAMCYSVLAECMAGKREIPTPEELVNMLPEIIWPE